MLLPSPLDHSVQRILCPTVFEPQIKLLNPLSLLYSCIFEIFRVGWWWVEELIFCGCLWKQCFKFFLYASVRQHVFFFVFCFIHFLNCSIKPFPYWTVSNLGYIHKIGMPLCLFSIVSFSLSLYYVSPLPYLDHRYRVHTVSLFTI